MKATFLIALTILAGSCTVLKPKEKRTKIVYQTDELVITQLSPNTYEHTSYLQTESFGKVDCNGMVVVSKNEALVLDTTPDSATSATLINWVQKQLHCKVTAVVATHFHLDNLGGLKAFDQAGIASYANDKTIQYAKERKENIPAHGFADSIDFKVGDEHVPVRFFGEGHTRDNVIAYFPADDVLFGGCLIKELHATKGNLADANEQAWSATVTRIKQAYPHVKTIIPGHGKRGNQRLLDYTIGLFRE